MIKIKLTVCPRLIVSPSVYPSMYGKPGGYNTLSCTVALIGISGDNASCLASQVYSA